jgi:hypothetical protein
VLRSWTVCGHVEPETARETSPRERTRVTPRVSAPTLPSVATYATVRCEVLLERQKKKMKI